MTDVELSSAETRTIAIGEVPLTLADVVALSRGEARPVIRPDVQARMEASAAVVREHLLGGAKVYGVTTGVGESVRTEVPHDLAGALSLNLLRFHGCGTGRSLTPEESAAVVAVRLSSLTRGCSGIRPAVAVRLAAMLEHRVLPVIPAEGSVGASGDLTPLSYVAATLVGEREVYDSRGQVRPTADVLAEHGWSPLTLGPKEALTLMNGTSVATAIGVLAVARAQRLQRWTATLTALTLRAMEGNPECLDPFLHATKAHPGQQLAATWIREQLGDAAWPIRRLQDRYSLRCVPQILGVTIDASTWCQSLLEIELQGVSDNPIVDPDAGRILHGGNFYGGHVTLGLDTLKSAVAQLADLLDRQVVLLCIPEESGDLARNLVGVNGPEQSIHHGFKAMSIAASALAAEALKLTLPAAAFSRSTESHNQDKVPMATLAARDAVRILELVEQVAAIATLAACQAADLRGMKPEGLHRVIRDHIPQLTVDRRMDRDIQTVLELLRGDHLNAVLPQ